MEETQVMASERSLLRTAAEIEREFGISRFWLYRQAKKGLLPHYKVGVAVRFSPAELLRALRAPVATACTKQEGWLQAYRARDKEREK